MKSPLLGATTRSTGTGTGAAQLRGEASAQAQGLAQTVKEAIAGGAPWPATLQQTAEAIVAQLDAALSRVWTIDPSGGVLELRASAGMYTHLDGGHARVRVGAFKIGRIAEEKLPHLTNDVANDPRVGDQDWARREGLVSFAGYPMVASGRLLGVIAMFSKRPLTAATLESLVGVAEILSLHVEQRLADEVRSALLLREQDAVATAALGDARIRFLADAIPHQVWTAKPDGQLDYVNRRVVEYFGRKAEDVIGHGWLELLHPDDVAGCVERWTHSLSTGDPYEFEFRLWSVQERRYRWHVALAHPRRDEAGRIVQWAGTNTDIDSRRRVEDAQRILLDAGRRFAATLDYGATLDILADICVPAVADWCVVDIITAGAIVRVRIRHRDPARASMANRLRRFVGAARKQHPGAAILEGRQPVLIEEITSAHLDAFAPDPEHRAVVGEINPCSLILVPLAGVDGVIGLVSLLTTPESGRRLGLHDLALAEELGLRAALALQSARHHREAREALVAQGQAVKALELSNRELDQFAYVASHDLKAPLRGIATLSQWIEEGVGDKLGEEDREHLRLLRGRVNRLEALIDGILSYSRAGRTREARENIDVARLLADLVDLIAAPAGARVEIGPSMPTLYAERAPLQQVLMNLINNAIKHAGRPDAVVKVTCEVTPKAYDFAVSDNGPGIAPRFHERIWVIFQTLQARDKVEGTGIGLSVVKKIVEARGGWVTVDSREGAGATFHVFWPRRPEELS